MYLDKLTYEQCVEQGVAPLVFPNRLAQGDRPEDECQRMKAVCVQVMHEQVKLRHTLEVAWHALEQAGIHAVLMKGVGLAALYPSMERRAWGDIDLFVGKEYYHPACAVMRDTFPNALKFDEELDHYKHYNLIADGISIEIHRVSVGLQHPIDEWLYARFESFGMSNGDRLVVNGLELTVPEPTFNALFVFLHAWEHMMTKGANIRQLYDLKLLLQHYKDRIDRPRLKHYLRALHLLDVWRVYMGILTDKLGLLHDDAPFFINGERLKVRSERVLEDMLNPRYSEVSIQKSEVKKNRFARKWGTMKERLKNAKRVARYSPAYARHMVVETMLHGGLRIFAKDRHWE